MKKAVFLDKDGTLIPDIPYNVDPSLISLSADAIDGLRLMQQLGYLLIVVSNQSGVALGRLKEDDLVFVEKELTRQLSEHRITLNGFYYCPHHPAGISQVYAINCQCRKPMPGMLLKAASEHKISLADSWMIGDILNDVEAGNRAGCKSILINNGNETEWETGEYRKPFTKVANINDAANIIYETIACETLDRL